MNGVILYADDDVLQPNSFENKLFSKFHADSKYPILPITSIQDLERTIQSLSTIRVLILDWEFRVPKEDPDMPDRNENPLDWLMSHHIYSLIYIYSRVDIKDKIKKDLKTRYGENKIFFKRKAIGNSESQEYESIYNDIVKFEEDNKHMELPFIWSQSINHFIHSIFNELETASPNWIKEIRDTAKNDGAEPISEVINIFNNLLNESIIQNKTLRDALNTYSYEDQDTYENQDKPEENTAKLYQRIFYTKITDDAPIMTGDIFKFNDNEYGILITPECEIREKKEFALDFLIFEIKNINKYLLKTYNYGSNGSPFNEIKEKQKEKLRKIFNNSDSTIHLLPSFPFLSENINEANNTYNRCACIYLRKAFAIKKKEEYDDKRIGYKLNSPYIQQLRQRYVAFFGRYGVPAIPETLRDFNLSG